MRTAAIVSLFSGLLGLSSFAYGTEAPLLGVIQPSGPLQEIRVLVFPHINHYVMPHGRDTEIDQVTIRARMRGANCRAFSQPEDTLVQEFYELLLRAKDMDRPLRIQCDGPARVVREVGLAVREYLGPLYARRAWTSEGNAYVELVHVTPFEDYLKGVVPAEMSASWHPEALRAQAVAARSYAYFQAQYVRRFRRHSNYDVDDTILYQAYLGHSGRAATTDAAVDATRDQILMYGSEVVKAYFHADSGGHTEDAENVWPGDAGRIPYCRGRPEEYDPRHRDSRWTRERTLDEIIQALRKYYLLREDEELSSVEIGQEMLSSGRPKDVVLVLEDGRKKIITAERFRYANALRSPWFWFTPLEQGRIRLDGLGYGHGVGMSQWGAHLSAKTLGWGYKRILEFYYMGARVEEVLQPH